MSCNSAARRGAVVVCVLAALTAAAPRFRTAHAAEHGRITGIVRHAQTGRPQSGVEVTLSIGGRRDRQIERRSFTTGRDGRFSFARLATGTRHVYALDATYDTGLFAGGALTLPAGTDRPPVIETTLRVWNTTDDPRSIFVRRDDLFVVKPKGTTAPVIETVTVVNTAERAYVGRASGRGTGAALGFALPAATTGGVSIVRADLDVPGIVETSFGFATTIAIPPGEHKITFAYSVEGSGGGFDLSRPALYPILEAGVFAPPELRVATNRLRREGEETVDGDRYVHYSSANRIEAGDTIQIVAIAEGSSSDALRTGGIAIVAVVLVAGALAFVVQRRLRPAVVRPTAATHGSRETAARSDLILELARLDNRYRAGEVDEQTWERQRRALKDRVRSLVPQEETPSGRRAGPTRT